MPMRSWHSFRSSLALKALIWDSDLLNIVISSVSPVETFALMGLLNLDYGKKTASERETFPCL